MKERIENKNKSISNHRHFLQQRVDKANPRHELTTEETKRLRKLEVITDRLKRGESVQSSVRVTYIRFGVLKAA